jgi:hypothetical protein
VAGAQRRRAPHPQLPVVVGLHGRVGPAYPEPPRRVAALSGNRNYGRLGLGAMDSRWPPAASILCRRTPALAKLHLQKHLRISVLHSRLFCVNLFATTAASEASSDPTPFAIEDYLVATCVLTRDKAIKASKTLSHLKSPSKHDAVLAFRHRLHRLQEPGNPLL